LEQIATPLSAHQITEDTSSAA